MRKIVAIGILIFGIYLIISLSRSVLDLWQKQDEVEKARNRVKDLAQENNRLKSQFEYVQTQDFVEKMAREKLNLVKPGETVVFIPQSVLREATASAAPTPPPPNWQQWIRLFF